MTQPDPCQECGAPLDRQQRYCVSCGARSSAAVNPASRYFAAASRQRRQAVTASAAKTARVSSTGMKTASVFFFALLPIAVAVGVIVGRSGSSPDQQAILDALRDSNATAATASSDAGSATPVSDTSGDLLSSDFSLDKGYTVKIGALPIASTDQAAADSAASDAEDKGAKDVGIINPGDFATSPDQGQDDYILYSGEFSDKGAASKALAGLKKDFPDAVVIEVTGSGAGSPAASDAGGGGKVVSHTAHGDVHQVAGAPPPTDEEIQHSTQIVNQIADQQGQDYTQGQEQLPDVIPVGGDPGDAPPLPTGAGD